MRRYAALAMFVLGAPAASAHDVWLTLDGDAAQRRVIVNYGHPDDRPPAAVDKIVDLISVAADATDSLRDGLSIAKHDGAMIARSKPFADDGHRLLAARYDNGFWVKTSDGFVNATKRSAPAAQESVWSGKFAKALSGPEAPWGRVLGHDLELVPLSDPVRVAAGDAFKLRVRFRGRPLAGTEVERGDGVSVVPEKDIPRFTTDADGIATVPLPATGAYLLVVDYRVTPSAAPDQADADLFNATLWFEVSGR